MRRQILTLLAFFTLPTMAAFLLIPSTSHAADKKKDQFDPAILKDLADNTWVDLGIPWRGGHEIPAVFDAGNHLFFKYGGCGDVSPRINVQGSKRPNETYGNSCWVVNVATGKWEMRRPRDLSFPAERPANGCSRCYAYDSKRKLIWMYGGISNGGGGGDQWDLWTYDGAKDTFAKHKAAKRPPAGDENDGDIFVYDSIRDQLIMPRGPRTWIYDIAMNAWEERKTPNGPPKQRHYSSMAFDPASMRLIFPVAVPTGKQAVKLESGMQAARWRPTEKGYQEYEFQTWSYDSEKNAWKNMQPAAPPEPAYRRRFGLTYDSKNGVVILVAGTSDTWDEREEYFNDIWVYDPAKNTWTKMTPAGAKPRVSGRECRHCVYDPESNVVFFLPTNGSLWAYRLKK